jgi:hypothetical protein
MGEYVAQQNIGRGRSKRSGPGRPTAEAIGRRLLDVVVYTKGCRAGDTLMLNDLAETSEVGDWKMPDYKMACTYAAAQGWLIIKDDSLMLTTAGSAFRSGHIAERVISPDCAGGTLAAWTFASYVTYMHP